MAFSIQRTRGAEPDTAVITIWGTDEALRNAMQKRGTPVDIEAGYDDNFGLLFRGEVRRVFFQVDGAETMFKIEAGDGDKALASQLRQQAFPRGATPEQIVADLLDSLGAKADDAKRKISQLFSRNPDAQKAKQKGFSVTGLAKDTLKTVLDSFKIDYSIQDGTVIVAEKDKPSENFPTAVSLSSTTGLIGAPEQGEDGAVSVTSLLQPGIRPYRQLQLKSQSIQGTYVVSKVEHRGDTHGQDWYSIAEATELT